MHVATFKELCNRSSYQMGACPGIMAVNEPIPRVIMRFVYVAIIPRRPVDKLSVICPAESDHVCNVCPNGPCRY